MSNDKHSIEEVLDSLTGFDEMAITQHFGRAVSELTKDESMLVRALVFVLTRRGGANDEDARNTVLGMPLKEVLSFFETADEAAEPGKGEPSSVSAPPVEQHAEPLRMISPTSA